VLIPSLYHVLISSYEHRSCLPATLEQLGLGMLWMVWCDLDQLNRPCSAQRQSPKPVAQCYWYALHEIDLLTLAMVFSAPLVFVLLWCRNYSSFLSTFMPSLYLDLKEDNNNTSFRNEILCHLVKEQSQRLLPPMYS
jgi:hypothetical protein